VTIAESIERHLRLSNAAIEWSDARDRMLQAVTANVAGGEVEAACREFERAVEQLAATVRELKR
jgi:hypothetical protein